MAIIGGSSTKNAVPGAETDTPALTPEQVIEQLREMRNRIPDFTQLPDDDLTKKMRRLASVDVEFTREAFATVGASGAVRNIIGNTPDELHQAQDEMSRWTAVESELRAMLGGVKAANIVRRQRIGRVAMQAYNVSRQLVKEQDHADLLPHVARMRQMKRFGRRRAKPSAEPQQPALVK